MGKASLFGKQKTVSVLTYITQTLCWSTPCVPAWIRNLSWLFKTLHGCSLRLCPEINLWTVLLLSLSLSPPPTLDLYLYLSSSPSLSLLICDCSALCFSHWPQMLHSTAVTVSHNATGLSLITIEVTEQSAPPPPPDDFSG